MLQGCAKLVDGDPRFADERAQGSLGQASVIRNNEASMWRKGTDRLRSRDYRELGQTGTSMTSSSIGGGMGSSWALKLSR